MIHIRRRFFKEQGRISTIAKSATDKRWAAEVTKPTGRALILMEGLTMYLTEGEVKRILSIICGWFGRRDQHGDHESLCRAALQGEIH